uniref:Uncharacterized protein n=1 Tax=Ditylum brightwellii TaxID=49249 RepID=A0A7S4QQ77_9STRA|mmetsp:Transcript_8028/g.10590  ORF Transcript_8028/g.10590 Transcript_8028/m.10590 type:complete len:144 (+) Transcript_8028:48-479(+)
MTSLMSTLIATEWEEVATKPVTRDISNGTIRQKWRQRKERNEKNKRLAHEKSSGNCSNGESMVGKEAIIRRRCADLEEPLTFEGSASGMIEDTRANPLLDSNEAHKKINQQEALHQKDNYLQMMATQPYPMSICQTNTEMTRA